MNLIKLPLAWASIGLLASSMLASAADSVPAQFRFRDQVDVARSTLIKSNTITVTGIDAPATIDIEYCSGAWSSCGYSINGGPFSSAAATVSDGDTVKVRLPSAGTCSTRSDLRLTIGGVSDTFSVTTVPVRGDVDGDGRVSLSDAGYSLQVVAGMATSGLHPGADVDGDTRIGQPEALHVLRSLAGLDPDLAGQEVTVDETGTVSSTVIVAGPKGSRLTLHAGSRIVLLNAAGEPRTFPASDQIRLALLEETASQPSLPAGIDALGGFRIVLTIDDIEREAWFWPASAAGVGEASLSLVLPLGEEQAEPGTLGLLFDVASGKAVRVDTSVLADTDGYASGPALKSIAGTSADAPIDPDSPQMDFTADHTGSYVVGGSASGTEPPPPGMFWSSFTVPDPGCVTVDGVEICGPNKVQRIEIVEESTAEVIGSCRFGTSDTASTGVLPPGYQFWCTRSQAPGGGPTEIKVYSTVANLPLIHAWLVRISDSGPMWEVYHRATGGVHAPGGGEYTDPYQEKDFQFAVHKHLTFTSPTSKKITYFYEHALRPLQEAGYNAVRKYFEMTASGSTYIVDVDDTLDARVLLEENVILKDSWTLVGGEGTRGNRGTYKAKPPSYRGTFTVSTSMGLLAQPWTGHGQANWVPNKDTGDYGEYDVTGSVTPDQTTYDLGGAVCILDQPEQPIANLGQIKDYTKPPTVYWLFEATWSATCHAGGNAFPMPGFLQVYWASSCAAEAWAPVDASYPEHLRGSFTWTGCPAPPTPISTATVTWDFAEQN